MVWFGALAHSFKQINITIICGNIKLKVNATAPKDWFGTIMVKNKSVVPKCLFASMWLLNSSRQS